MTFKQLFVRFCKKNNIYPEVNECIRKRIKEINDRNLKYGFNDTKPSDVDSLIQSALIGRGIYRFFETIMGYGWNIWALYEDYPKLRGAVRKWRYFAEHNIILNPSIEKGDNVTIKSWGKYVDCTVDGNNFTAMNCNSCRIKKNTDGGVIYRSIFEFNDIHHKPLKLNFSSKERGKIYN